MRYNIRVYLGDRVQPIGTIRYDSQGARESAIFEYDATWLASSEHFAIEPGLPLVAGPQFHRKHRDGSVFHNSIADTEPDGWGRRVILRDHAKRRQKERKTSKHTENRPLNRLDFLLAADDFSRVGALRFQDENGVFLRTPEDGRRSAPPLVELAHLMAATRAVESNNETTADLAYLRGRGTSLGGMRPKCTVIDDDGCLSIGKFPGIADERPVTKGEVLVMQLAVTAGINAAHARLIDSDGVPVALIRRFDRSKSGGRMMYVSAATMLGVEPADSAGHSYTEIVDAIRAHGADAQNDIDELWRRIAFSILVTNVDDHLLNHGFLHVEHGKWRLAPAFDINPFPERVRELKTWISEETGPAATIEALLSAAPYFRITHAHAKKILDKVEHAVAMWRKQGRVLGMTKADLDLFGEAFEHPERQAARKIAIQMSL
ncbi:MAG: phosphatidylinositol kinase [Bdellovibrionales bacterium RIFOXYD1_FULL_53_11]|nr:MAG: phosphatidylinositol kinase [Bdellovibrionales bacterium RIFOXYD1_FULL_53_11]